MIFTIGHSNHTIDKFLILLKKYEINCIVDVRSVPYSSFNSQFNKEKLWSELLKRGIYYVPMSKELGAKRTEEEVYANGQVVYPLVWKTQLFQSGYNRLVDGINKGFKIALMCSEKNPYECHRSLMIGRYLNDKGIDVVNILEDGSSMSQTEVGDYLLRNYSFEVMSSRNLFDQRSQTDEEKLSLVYDLQNQKVALLEDQNE